MPTCPTCSAPFQPHGTETYCSAYCAFQRLRTHFAEHGFAAAPTASEADDWFRAAAYRQPEGQVLPNISNKEARDVLRLALKHFKPVVALLALLLAFPALAAPAHRAKPLETVTVKTMPAGTLKRAEYYRITTLDRDSCTAWIEASVYGQWAFRACDSAILRCQAGDCRRGGAR